MRTIRKLNSAWILTLVGSLLLPLVSVAAVSGTTYDTPYATTTTPATTAEHTVAIETVDRGETSLRGMPNGQTWSLLGLSRILDAPKTETEIIQRAMSREELQAIKDSGVLSRGGRAGPHYASDAVNANALRARQRLSLPQTPEVRATLEVPKGTFSAPSKVAPKYNMPGGGMERTAPGNLDIPANILDVLEY